MLPIKKPDRANLSCRKSDATLNYARGVSALALYPLIVTGLASLIAEKNAKNLTFGQSRPPGAAVKVLDQPTTK